MERSATQDSASARMAPDFAALTSGCVCPDGQNTSPPRQSLPAKIFHFTEIRNCGIHRNSPVRGRGAVRLSFETWAGLRWTRQRRAREAWAGRIALREPEASCRRAALRVRLADILPATSTRPGDDAANSEPCVRQNRVVLAVVATVKLLRRRHSRQPARCPRLSRGEGGQREFGSRESTA